MNKSFYLVINIKIYGTNILYLLLSFIPVLFLNNFASASIIYLIAWAFFITIYIGSKPYIVIHKELMELKQKNGWFCGKVREITVDTAASRLKNKKVIPIYWLLGSFIIPIVCLALSKSSNLPLSSTLTLPIIDLIVKIIILLIYKYTKKLKTKVYSEHSEINIALNCERQRLFSLFLTLISYVDSISFFITYLMICGILPYNIIVLVSVITISSFLTVLLIFYYYDKFRKTKQNLISNDDKPIITDDDEYWINGLIYCNPNDNSLLVEKRGGIGMTINFGKKSGKIITYITLAFIALLIIGIPILTIAEESTNPSLKVFNSNEVKIDCSFYSTSFSTSDIASISLSENMPDGIRTNGISTDEYSRGHYDLNQYGTSRVYVYNNNPPYIVIKLKDNTYVFFNDKDKSNTLNLYNDLKKLKH